MNMLSCTKEQIRKTIEEVKEPGKGKNAKILFVPNEINDRNFRQVCEVYAAVYPHNFETIVVLEGVDRTLKRSICLSDSDNFETPFGMVPANTRLVDDFCDEEDDFYQTDDFLRGKETLTQQLMMLQAIESKEFRAVGIQVSNREDAVVMRELSLVMSDVLPAYNALIVCCCDMHVSQKQKLERLMQYLNARDGSNLKYLINQEDLIVHGKSALLAGILLAQIWDLEVEFLDGSYSDIEGYSLVAGYALNKRYE